MQSHILCVALMKNFSTFPILMHLPQSPTLDLYWSFQIFLTKLLSRPPKKQAMLVRQLEEELRMRMRQPNIEMQQQMEAIFAENEHLTREIAILRDTIKVSNKQ